MRIVNMPHAVNKDSKEELLKPNEVRHKRNMRSGSTDSNHMGCCENIKGNVKIPNPYVNPVVEEFNIQTIADPYESGLTSGGGSYLSGQTATVIATHISPNEFVNWTEDGVVSTESEYSFAVLRSRILTANFVDPIFHPKFGLLYTPQTYIDSREITASGWSVPNATDWGTLVAYLGGSSVAGGKLKETGTEFFSTNVGATNSAFFNGRGSGVRSSNGVFSSILSGGVYSVYTNPIYNVNVIVIYGLNTTTSLGVNNTFTGTSIRPFRLATVDELLLPDGVISATYIGNDLKEYECMKAGTQIWVNSNLAETKFRTGEYIPGYDGGVYTPFTNAAWAALTTAGVCAYEDNLANV